MAAGLPAGGCRLTLEGVPTAVAAVRLDLHAGIYLVGRQEATVTAGVTRLPADLATGGIFLLTGGPPGRVARRRLGGVRRVPLELLPQLRDFRLESGHRGQQRSDHRLEGSDVFGQRLLGIQRG